MYLCAHGRNINKQKQIHKKSDAWREKERVEITNIRNQINFGPKLNAHEQIF